MFPCAWRCRDVARPSSEGPPRRACAVCANAAAFGTSMMLMGVGKTPGGGGGGGSLTSNPVRKWVMTAIAQRRSWRHNFRDEVSVSHVRTDRDACGDCRPWDDHDGTAAKPIRPATRFTGQRTIDRRCRSDKDRATAIPKSKIMREAL